MLVEAGLVEVIVIASSVDALAAAVADESVVVAAVDVVILVGREWTVDGTEVGLVVLRAVISVVAVVNASAAHRIK